VKILYSIFLLLFSAVGFAGQTATNFSGMSGVEVIEKKWRVEVRNPALDEDPFRAVNERNRAEIDKRENMRQNEIRQRQGRTSESVPVRVNSNEAAPRDPWVTYFYELKIKNTGEREIRVVTWDYIFFEPKTKREVGRRRFISDTDINPGKIKNLIVRTAIPPTNTVNAGKAAKKAREQYEEQVVIYSIEYGDRSIRRPASN
jgi:hypothetical protein